MFSVEPIRHLLLTRTTTQSTALIFFVFFQDEAYLLPVVLIVFFGSFLAYLIFFGTSLQLRGSLLLELQ